MDIHHGVAISVTALGEFVGGEQDPISRHAGPFTIVASVALYSQHACWR